MTCLSLLVVSGLVKTNPGISQIFFYSILYVQKLLGNTLSFLGRHSPEYPLLWIIAYSVRGTLALACPKYTQKPPMLVLSMRRSS